LKLEDESDHVGIDGDMKTYLERVLLVIFYFLAVFYFSLFEAQVERVASFLYTLKVLLLKINGLLKFYEIETHLGFF